MQLKEIKLSFIKLERFNIDDISKIKYNVFKKIIFILVLKTKVILLL